MSGGIFVPLEVSAGFFGSMLTSSAHAQDNVPNNIQISNNSQTMSLLQANVSSAAVLDEKKDSKKASPDVDPNASVNILAENALLPATSPIGVSDGTDVPDASTAQMSVYVVRAGDSISQIADMFDVSVNTILWANDMKKGQKLVAGDTLIILPVSGVKHIVTKGQTLQTIAKLYKADITDIAQFNDLSEDAKLAVGDELIIPDGERAEESDKPVKNLAASNAKDIKYYQSHPTIKNAAGYYINPVPGYRKSQGIHDHNAVDLAIGIGTPIHAAADGRVILARNGYNGGFGNVVIIAHPNGTETLYAHQSKIATTTGAQVSQGQVIGYVGSTGHSTGPHLHFEVHGARNPGADGSWKY
jgi:LysM repeat protein